eukprot:8898848-Alexandrium_andersonii.AAC.1
MFARRRFIVGPETRGSAMATGVPFGALRCRKRGDCPRGCACGARRMVRFWRRVRVWTACGVCDHFGPKREAPERLRVSSCCVASVESGRRPLFLVALGRPG